MASLIPALMNLNTGLVLSAAGSIVSFTLFISIARLVRAVHWFHKLHRGILSQGRKQFSIHWTGNDVHRCLPQGVYCINTVPLEVVIKVFVGLSFPGQ